MDVTKFISELRFERQKIEQAIIDLERFNRPRTGIAEVKRKLMTDADDVSQSDGAPECGGLPIR